MNKRVFKGEELEDVRGAIECGELVNESSWRWGTHNTYVFEHEGKNWQTTIEVHCQDGWQIYGSIDAVEVHQVEKTVKVWEPVP
jgi:hypothetical protein